MRHDDTQIEHHADRDEEETEQHVPERLDVLLDLIAVFGLGDQHAGEKRSERKRQPRKLGQRGESECHEQKVQHEELGTLLPRDDVEPRPHRLLAGEKDERQRRRRLERGDREVAHQFAAALPQGRNHDQERNHREILEQQDAHDVAAMRRRDLHLLGEHLRDDRRRAHREHPAEREAGLPTGAEQMQQDHRGQRRDGDLREPESEHCAAHRFELRQAELEADREHQEDDAEFGQVPDVGGLGHEGERMRADREPDEEIAQDGRQANQPAQDDRDNRCAEQNQNQLQCLRHRERGATRESGRESM